MAKLLKLRRGTTTQHGSFTGAEGEVTIDTTKDTAVVHDGSTAGGTPLAKEDMSNVSSASIAGRLSNDSIAPSKIGAGTLPSDVTVASANIVDGSIVNADVNASAAIAGTKIAPDFGSQNITTTGNVQITNVNPNVALIDSNSDSDFQVQNDNGNFNVRDTTNSANRLRIDASGGVNIPGNTDFGAGVDVTGNITATGDVDIGGNIELNDNRFVYVGDSQDGRFYHDQSNTYLEDNGTGELRLASNNGAGVRITKGSSETLANFTNDGACELYNDNALKLNTTGSGINVTGNIAVSGTVDGRDVAADGSKLDGGIMLADGDKGDITVSNSGGTFTIDNDVVTTAKMINFPTGTLLGRSSSGTGNATTLTASEVRTLLNVENGATADQTKSDIDALNINADQVDGMHANEFLAVAGDQATGDITFSGGAGAVTVSGGSDIRLAGGNWTGDYTSGIKIQPTASDSYFQFQGALEFRRTNGASAVTVSQSGDLTAVGNVTAYSDARLKTDIHTINDALGICGKLRGVSYKWIRDGKPSIGVIAQEVEEVIPEVVLTSHDVDPSTGEVEEIKSVDYGKIVGVLINAINELKEEVEELKNAKITG